MKYTYNLQCQDNDGNWISFRPVGMQYGHGFLDAREGQAPRNALRLVRSDGKVVREVAAKDDVNIGMVAGWPSAEQYERAGKEALEKARIIRERNGGRRKSL